MPKCAASRRRGGFAIPASTGNQFTSQNGYRASHKRLDLPHGTDRALVSPGFPQQWELSAMRAVLDHCTGGTERQVEGGTVVVSEGGTSSGHLYVLIEGKLEVLKSDMVVA